MPVLIWSENSLEPRIVEGDLLGVTQEMNNAGANGKLFAILTQTSGRSTAVRMDKINFMDETEDDGAFIG